jgi:hypothetical protein
MKTRALHLAALVWLLSAGQPAIASIDAVFSLGTPSVSGTTVSFDVNLDFTASGPDSNLELGFFGLDVSPSSGALTAMGTDFSAFSFTLNSAQFTGDWGSIKDFGGPVGPGTVQYQSLFNLLPSGNYQLGTLSVDLSVAGVSLDPSLFVSIAGSDTQFGAQDPTDFTTFTIYPGSFTQDSSRPLVPGPPAVVPEPTTCPLWLAGGGVLLLQVLRRMRACGPGSAFSKSNN